LRNTFITTKLCRGSLAEEEEEEDEERAAVEGGRADEDVERLFE
jgi:hypothetical protein